MKPSPRFISGLEQNISVLFGSDTIFNLFPRKWKQQGVGSRGREGASQRAPGRGQWTPLEAGVTRYWSSVGSEVRARDKTMVMPQGGWCIGLVTPSTEMVTVWWLVICLVRAGQHQTYTSCSVRMPCFIQVKYLSVALLTEQIQIILV